MQSSAQLEFVAHWLPHTTTAGLNRLIELLEKNSPLLIHGQFTQACVQGCLASHLAWNHPATSHLGDEAGVRWLTRIAGLNPATSAVVLAWDRTSSHDWATRKVILNLCREELQARQQAEAISPEVDELLATI